MVLLPGSLDSLARLELSLTQKTLIRELFCVSLPVTTEVVASHDDTDSRSFSTRSVFVCTVAK